MKRLDGKQVAAAKQALLIEPIRQFTQTYHRPPQLNVILVGDDPASQIYIDHKIRCCNNLGIQSQTLRLPASITMISLLSAISEMNHDDRVDGILLQLPLPEHLDPKVATASIASAKDVDGFTPENIGRLASQQPFLRPCTPWGIIQLLRHYDIDLKGKHALVIGASQVVGRPLCLEFLLANATVSCCHKYSTQVAALIPQADIIVSAIGKREVYDYSHAKNNAVIVDVGIHHLDNGQIVGDICLESLNEHQGFVTPVPGGVGPMTVVSLMQNTLLAAQSRMSCSSSQ